VKTCQNEAAEILLNFFGDISLNNKTYSEDEIIEIYDCFHEFILVSRFELENAHASQYEIGSTLLNFLQNFITKFGQFNKLNRFCLFLDISEIMQSNTNINAITSLLRSTEVFLDWSVDVVSVWIDIIEHIDIKRFVYTPNVENRVIDFFERLSNIAITNINDLD
jgi:hypothetical protein